MLPRRLPTILPAMTLADAIDTTCLHRVAARTGERTAFATTHPCRAPHHTISHVGLIGGGHLPTPGEGARAPTAGAAWMNCRSASGMSSRSCDNHLRRVSYTYNLTGVLDLNFLASFAVRLLSFRGSARGR
jgi:hypothetical protein